VGVADIVGLGICWVFVALVLTWGVLSEGRSRAPGEAPPEPLRLRLPPPAADRPARFDGAAGAEWVVVERLAGTGPEVHRRGELLVSATLAARGRDLSPGDQRVEVAERPGGDQETLFLLRPESLSPSEPG
jgi:hypothetical protein